jgi:hypothetical protein
MFKYRKSLAALALGVVLVSALVFWKLRNPPLFDRGVACKWDPAQVATVDDTCNKQCALIPYFGGTTKQSFINGKTIHFCCSKGYSEEAVKDPITHLPVDVICRKDGT